MDWVIGTVTVWYQASLDEPVITKFKDYAGLTFMLCKPCPANPS